MKNFLFIALFMSCLCSCSQSNDVAGEYQKTSKSGSVQFLLTLNPNGTFHFDSYGIRQVEGKILNINASSSAAPGNGSTVISGNAMSGRGTWRAENNIIYFSTDPDSDIDYANTLNLNETKAKFETGTSEDMSDEKAPAKLEFIESGIFWIKGIELEKRYYTE